MKIETLSVLHCDAGWRPWTFVKIMTDTGLIGWSECTDSHGSPRAIEGVVRDLSPLLVGHDPRRVEKLYWDMYSRTRQSPGSVVQKAIAGIENALLDIKARDLGVSVADLFGGTVRDRVRVYWSHCGTSRVRAADLVRQPPISSYDDVRKFGEEVRSRGYNAVKTNIAILDDNPRVYMPGFAKSGGGPELNADRALVDAIARWVETLRKALGRTTEVMLDLNFNFKTDGYIAIGRALEEYDLAWLEIDSYDPEALREIRRALRATICSGENLYGARQYRPYFTRHAMGVASIDVIWNGFAQSKKIADLAEIYEINVTPHNYNGHLSTFISAQFAALVPNFRILEYDVDDVPWREDLFTAAPRIANGYMEVPAGPGWGIEVNEHVLHAHPWPR